MRELTSVWEWARTRPALIAAAVVTVPIVAGPQVQGAVSVPAFLAVCLISYAAGAYTERVPGAIAVGLLIVSLQIGMGFSDFPNVEILVVTLAPFWIGWEVGSRGALVTRLAAQRQAIQDEQEAFVRLSVRHERSRIARELHDIVAHHLAVIVVQAGAGRMATRASPELTTERFQSIQQAGDQALDEMARLVDLLHSDDATGDPAARWQALADEARAGGIEVEIAPMPCEDELSAEIATEAYRIVREAVTNAIKHASGATVRVGIERVAEELRIDVVDDGSRGDVQLAATGSGLGLVGVRERVSALGGSFVAGPAPSGGWRVSAVLPVRSRVTVA
jgi:signal transduction histidine kinase